MNTGDKVTIKRGWGYNQYDPLDFKRSDGTVQGIVVKEQHKNPNTTLFRLNDGRLASTATSGLELVG